MCVLPVATIDNYIASCSQPVVRVSITGDTRRASMWYATIFEEKKKKVFTF